HAVDLDDGLAGERSVPTPTPSARKPAMAVFPIRRSPDTECRGRRATARTTSVVELPPSLTSANATTSTREALRGFRGHPGGLHRWPVGVRRAILVLGSERFSPPQLEGAPWPRSPLSTSSSSTRATPSSAA